MTGKGYLRALADGNEMPVLGLGVWRVPNGRPCIDAVRWALELGYRHIDTAQAYGNEESVGEGLRQSGVPREEVFVTTKFYPGGRLFGRRPDPAREIEQSLRRVGLDHVDLYIIHWPQGDPTWAWPGMERARELGHARSIGVSNFSARELEEVRAAARVAPVVNQVQFSPFEYREKLLEACRRDDVALEAYSPLGSGRYVGDATVVRVAERLGRTTAQILLRWCLEHELMVIPKSTHRERIEENSQIFDFSLSAEDVAKLDALDRTGRTDRARERKWW